jgi:hypothetical protein
MPLSCSFFPKALTLIFALRWVYLSETVFFATVSAECFDGNKLQIGS